MKLSEHDQTLDMLGNILTAIEKNHEATIQLAEALAGIRAVKTAKIEAIKAIDKAKEPEAPAEATPPQETAAPSSPAAPVASAPTTLDYKRDVSPTMAKFLAAKGAPAVVEFLSKYGVKKGADLPADKLPEVLAAAKSVLGE